MNELIKIFKSAGWQGVAYKETKGALSNLDNTKSFWCNYKDRPRLVNPEVCKWHQENKDPECRKCERWAG